MILTEGTYTNGSGPPPSTLTVESLLEIQRTIRAVPVLPELRESELAVQRSQRRVYARRRAKSVAHWQRMNKKWLKRFGETLTPAAFEADTGIAWGVPSKKILFVHPELMKLVRRHLKESMDRQFDDTLRGFGLGKSGDGK